MSLDRLVARQAAARPADDIEDYATQWKRT
jgi:hypothetical protein